MLIIPERFNKNAPTVRAMGSPADTGGVLLQYMCDRIGITGLQESDVLDFGCGCRFVDAIVNRGIAIKSYTGIDVDREMIKFLSANVADKRLKLIWWDAQHPNYNTAGRLLQTYRSLPVGDTTFDIICMFSVVTHQVPEDAENIFRLLRRHIRHDGHLFFSATVEALPEGYVELVPERPAAHSAYSLPLLRALLERTGWEVLSIAGKTPLGPNGVIPIQDSLLCVPVAPADL